MESHGILEVSHGRLWQIRNLSKNTDGVVARLSQIFPVLGQ